MATPHSISDLESISPATMTNVTLTNSIKSDVSLVKDPEFWRRFSMAVHRDEEEVASRTVTTENHTPDSWLVHQRKKARRSKIWGLVIAIAIVLIATGAAIGIWYMSKNGWFQKGNRTETHDKHSEGSEAKKL